MNLYLLGIGEQKASHANFPNRWTFLDSSLLSAIRHHIKLSFLKTTSSITIKADGIVEGRRRSNHSLVKGPRAGSPKMDADRW